MVRKISNGIPEINFSCKTCSVIDERGEIAAMYKGVPQNDIGKFTDVIDCAPKQIGITMAIRSMSPQIIICDEIGSSQDVQAIKKATLSGIKGIFTAHGGSIEEIKQNPNLKEIIDKNLIKRIIILDPKQKGKIKDVI